MIKLVIFDFDDTIVDNSKLDYKSFVIPCKQLGVSLPSKEYVIQMRRMGKLSGDIISTHLKKNKKPQILNEFLKIRTQFLHSLKVVNHLHLKKDTKSLLQELKRDKIKCVLCSVRTNKQIILNFISKNKIQKFFQEIILMEDLGFKIDNSNASNRTLVKSSLLNKIINENKIGKDQTLFIGNSIEDLEASRTMKIPFIYYQNTYLENLLDNTVLKIRSMDSLKRKIQSLQKEVL
ncbi:MAG: HAD hydrolase-like protein [Candidatus Nitrosotalea sp.]|nr:HAD hydrolase-like protein [Candidatus Nitrosotalea sp.]